MFSLLKKKPVAGAPVELTFKTRVERFWEWYATVAERFYRTIEDKKAPELAPEVSARIKELLPGFAWVFGPGANRQGHSFTLSGEGNLHRQLLAIYWQWRAPKLAGWTFYSARQTASDPGNWRFELGGLDFEAKALWLSPSVDVERKRIQLTVWHPLFPKLEEQARWTVVYLLLDETLGEVGTQNWIGQIDFNESKLQEAIPLAELPAYLRQVEAEHGWKKRGPGESWTVYRFDDGQGDFPRGDVLTGITNVVPLINEFARTHGELADPLAGSGADYLYVAFDARILPKGKESASRGEIEDALSEKLEAERRGNVLGGALGARFAYIDLLVYDGAASIRSIVETLRHLRLPEGTSLNYFAHEKRGRRIVI